MIGDMIYDETRGIDDRGIIVDAKDPTRRKRLAGRVNPQDLLLPAVRDGKVVAAPESLKEIRARRRENMQGLHPTIRRFMNPHEYPVGLDIGLHDFRDEMIHQARSKQLEGVP